MALFFPKQDVLFTHLPKTGGRFCRWFFTNHLKLKSINVGDFHSPAIICGYKYINTKSFHFTREFNSWIKSYVEWKGKSNILEPCEPHLLYHPTWKIDEYYFKSDILGCSKEYLNMIRLFQMRSKAYKYEDFHKNLSIICKEYFNIDISAKEISNLKPIK